ncbi:hypothetical protein A2774_00105 [Candidatus Roizmanbacteria bacterium RIFCSPHIGHO2_01_FULL_39_12c]|uniref:Nudix hydrolase domain-containing protein n=1 Tax=Candidatus Roizmanbacteria bacterium RIFCSPHIGHO2_01_FULL_39_12c TaxID=1802031 RepID=A0A1F7GCT2_9BACT|nr:MAG: hypothetical protein A2774_00105 [Candidatus Roizmanbacteria bacterium RIFCSPHIGHO2_01_FULL_39_12c]
MYIFCPRCSKKIAKKSESLYVCNHCGFHLYENPRPTNGLIAENEKGEILLVKRKDDPKKGYWDLPGGFVDMGETLEESFQREIKEELGVKVKNLKYLTSTADRYLYKGINLHTICFIFTGKLKGKELKIRDDISGFQFFPKDKIPFKRIAFTGVKKGIKYYLSSLK